MIFGQRMCVLNNEIYSHERTARDEAQGCNEDLSRYSCTVGTLKFSVLCWHFSAPGKKSTTGVVTRDRKSRWEGSDVEQVLKIKQPAGSADWKATGRGTRFAWVRTVTKHCEKCSASRFGAAHSAVTLTEEQPPLRCPQPRNVVPRSLQCDGTVHSWPQHSERLYEIIQHKFLALGEKIGDGTPTPNNTPTRKAQQTFPPWFCQVVSVLKQMLLTPPQTKT